MNATELFERQAAWQLARKDRSWEEKLNQSLRMRDAFQKLRNSKPIPPPTGNGNERFVPPRIPKPVE
jgi:hypothetical protein